MAPKRKALHADACCRGKVSTQNPAQVYRLEAAPAEVVGIKKRKRAEGLPDAGLRPFFADYARNYLKFQKTAPNGGRKPWTIAREGHPLVHWIATIGNARLDKIKKPNDHRLR